MTSINETANAAPPVRRGEWREMDGKGHARWMFDLEQALLEQGMKPYQAARQEEQAEPAPAREPHRERETARQSAEHAGLPAGAPMAAAQQVPAPADDATAPSPDVAVPAAPSGKAGQLPAAGLVQASPGSTGASEHLGAAAAPAPWLQPGAAPLAVKPVQLAVAATEDLAPPAPVSAIAPSPGGVPAARGAAPEVEGQAAEAAPAAPQAEAPGEPFDKKLMHLFYGQDGIHAWVRDAELQAGQLRRLAQELAAELGGEGQRLASLTVNGKKVAAGGEARNAGDAQQQAPAPVTNKQRSNT